MTALDLCVCVSVCGGGRVTSQTGIISCLMYNMPWDALDVVQPVTHTHTHVCATEVLHGQR